MIFETSEAYIPTSFKILFDHPPTKDQKNNISLLRARLNSSALGKWPKVKYAKTEEEKVLLIKAIFAVGLTDLADMKTLDKEDWHTDELEVALIDATFDAQVIKKITESYITLNTVST